MATLSSLVKYNHKIWKNTLWWI